MSAYIQMMEASSSSPSPPRAVWSRLSSSSGGGEYTSLKDVLSREGSGRGGACGSCTGDVHDFDTCSINIRDQLLKHAASVYLQSAVVIDATPRRRGCLGRLWQRLRHRATCLFGCVTRMWT